MHLVQDRANTADSGIRKLAAKLFARTSSSTVSRSAQSPLVRLIRCATSWNSVNVRPAPFTMISGKSACCRDSPRNVSKAILVVWNTRKPCSSGNRARS